MLIQVPTDITSTQSAHETPEDVDLHNYEEIEDVIATETKECAAQEKVDLDSNPAYVYSHVTTINTEECAAYAIRSREKVTTEANPAYQQVTLK